MAEFRKRKYKALKAKLVNKRQKEYEFDQTLSNLVSGLIPQTAPSKQASQPQNTSQEQLQALQDSFNKRLALMDKQNTLRAKQQQERNDARIQEMQDAADAERKKSYEINQNLKNAINKIAKQKQEKPKEELDTEETADDTTTSPFPSAETRSTTTSSTQTQTSEPTFNTDNAITETRHISAEEAAAEKTDIISSTVAKIGDMIDIGDNKYRITNTFGLRTGANTVPGREGEHSRGVDVVAQDAQGKITNAPIAVTDGVIQGVYLQGSGRHVGTNRREAGYYVRVKMPNGKIMNYMHLSPDIEKHRKNLVGKKIKRGDVLFEGDHTKVSGSATAPHVKINISSVDEKGNMLRDYDNPENNPTYYILHGNA